MNTSLNSTLRYTRRGCKQNTFIGNQLSHLLLHLIRLPVHMRRQSFYNLSLENIPLLLLYYWKWKAGEIKIKGKLVGSSIFTSREQVARVALIKGLRKRRWCTDVVAQEAKSQSTLIGKLQDDEINCLFFLKKLFAYILFSTFIFFIFAKKAFRTRYRCRNFIKIELTINHWSALTLE